MAVARILCGECGDEISRSDAVCPRCGAEVELPAPPGEEARVACDVCGERNPRGEAICSSCGARLPGAAKRRAGGKGGRKARKVGSERPRDRAKPGRKFEPWQVVSAVAVVVLVGYFVSTEISRDRPRIEGRPPQGGLAPAQMPVDIAPFEKAVEENPDDPRALLKLANVLQDAGDMPRAIGFYRKYLEIESDNPDARVDLGICYFELARADTVHGGALYEAAIREMEAAFERDSTHQHAAFNLGVVHLSFGNLEESTRWFRQAVELDGSSDLGVRARHLLEQHAVTQ